MSQGFAARAEQLPLPSREDGYAKVLFVGRTGAGKTTLLRHLIGSHPENDRFPSTSTAKTTISDIEIIVGGDDYRAVVTFFPENSTRTAIHECLTEACVADLNGVPDVEIADLLLNRWDRSPSPQRSPGFRSVDAEREAAFSMYEDELQADPEFDEIIADILEAVLARFELIAATGELERRKSGWPEKWMFSTDDREAFISTIRFFSSNSAASFGRLLTPLVDGIRVQGPLYPEFTTRRVPLILLDGQGLGHTPDVSGAISTHITEQFNQVDVILLVDNAQNPLGGHPKAAIEGHLKTGQR